MLKVLKVQEAHPGDAMKGIARVHREDMEAIGASEGDIVEITGKRKTAARIMAAAPEEARDVLRIDGLIRENARASLDEWASVSLATLYHVAGSVTLRPMSDAGQLDHDEEHARSLLDGQAVRAGDRARLDIFGTRASDFLVEATTPEGTVIVDKGTWIEILDPLGATRPHKVSYEDIGGLGSQIRKVRELIELPLRSPQIFERLGIQPPKGVLLYGPPGTGKTVIARAVANESDAWFTHISGPEVIGKFYGESEERLRTIFEEAQEHAPSIIFIDEIDGIAPKREEMGGEKQVERRVVAQLLALMDGLEPRGQVVVIGATNIPNSLDPALRRPGRFDREIAIPIPDRDGRLEILQIHTRGMPLSGDVDLKKIADVTHGFVGADIEALAKEAAMACVRDILPYVDLQRQEIPYERVASLEVGMRHFMAALVEIEPSAIREVFVEIPEVSWDDIAGLEEIKEELMRAVIWPLEHAELFEMCDIRPPKGILLHGPSGTGKTLLVKALARESGVNFIAVQGSSIVSRYMGESERALREVFRVARQAAPSILYFDEIESLFPARGRSSMEGRLLGQFLSEMSGIEDLHGVVVLATTNRPDLLDLSLLTAGRFDLVLGLPMPDRAARGEIFRIALRRKELAGDVDLGSLADRTEGASGADIAFVCRRAAMEALKSKIAVTGPQDMDGALVLRGAHFEIALRELCERMALARQGHDMDG